MRSAERAKERLMKDKLADTAFEIIAAEKANSGDPDYWRKACMEASHALKSANKSNELARVQVRILKEQKAGLDGEVNSLKAQVLAARAERDRFKREAKNLRKKLAALEEATEDIEDDEEYEKDEDGCYRAENDFDQRDHFREM